MNTGSFRMHPAGVGADLRTTSQERFVRDVYSSVDEAAARSLEALQREAGVTPSCGPGCCHCCRFHVLMNIAEAHALSQFVRREFSAEQTAALRRRTERWHEWDRARLARNRSGDRSAAADRASRGHPCPLLVGGICSAYPVRPVVCRTHFVQSPPASCLAAVHGPHPGHKPLVLRNVLAATHPISDAIKAYIEEAGIDYSRSIMFLPQWLDAAMEWELSADS